MHQTQGKSQGQEALGEGKVMRGEAVVKLGVLVSRSAMGVIAFALLVVSFSGARAWGAVPVAPAWGVTVAGVPSVLPVGVGRHGRFDVVVEDVGGMVSEAGMVVHDVLPTGLTATAIHSEGECTGSGSGEVECLFSEPVASGRFATVTIEFEETGLLAPGSSLRNVVGVKGGGGAAVSSEDSIRVQGEGERGPGPAGVAHFSMSATGPAGEPVSQAGAHPNLFTTSLLFNGMYQEGLAGPSKPVEAPRDLVFYLPLGVLGNATVADRCPVALVEIEGEQTGCSSGSQIGTILPLILSVFSPLERGIYNIQPEKGYAAEFAFASNKFIFVSYANVVKRDGTYMVRVSVPGIPSASGLLGLVASFFGDVREHYISGEGEFSLDRGAFLTDPTNCTEGTAAREATVAADTWEHPDPALPLSANSMVFPSLTGCEALRFSAALHVSPETTQADEPSGLEVGLQLPQAPNDFSGLGTPPVKDTTVALPAGMTVSPSSAHGLEACPEAGPDGINIEGGESEEVAPDGLERPAPGHCSPASQIATVRASTPLLSEELTGHMFLATPACGGTGQPACTIREAEAGNLIGLYLELEGPNSGVVVKLKGHATLKAGTGQVTASFEEIPQFPISSVVVATKQGAHAPLDNPQACGPATSAANLTPWSPGTPVAESSDVFSVDWNGGGQPCPASAPFAPSLSATTTIPQVASTSPFTLTLKREDREQNIAAISNTLPEGMLADISKATRCPEPQASEASLSACPAASQIGTATAAVGPGSDPYYETGKVFFTGPYAGAPFGLSVVVPAVAGPFNLGDVLVRVKLSVDPHTAQASAVSDPLPQELDGVPLRVRSLNVTLTDSEFVLNPTSCATMSITGTVASTTGASASVSSPFTAVGCDTLPFRPVLSTSTEALATKENGTGVRVKIAYPPGREANIAKVVIGFPKQIPVRLETLRKACPAATFEANPANCPAASNVGTATTHTPILAQPLTGPIYLVSHGSAKFPDAVLVLQGEGITLDVEGQSFVSQSGALKVTFASVPDAPFSTFEAILPAGRHSQFTSVKSTGIARGSQCGENLTVPVSMVAHDGAQLTQTLKMQVTGCKPTITITHARATAHGLTVTLRTTTQGRLRITGHGLRTLTKRNVSAGTHTLTIPFTPAGRAAVHAHRKTQLTAGLVAGKQKASTHKRVAL
jgi:hypothetical protein